jgi:hypothetical protein
MVGEWLPQMANLLMSLTEQLAWARSIGGFKKEKERERKRTKEKERERKREQMMLEEMCERVDGLIYLNGELAKTSAIERKHKK